MIDGTAIVRLSVTETGSSALFLLEDWLVEEPSEPPATMAGIPIAWD